MSDARDVKDFMNSKERTISPSSFRSIVESKVHLKLISISSVQFLCF